MIRFDLLESLQAKRCSPKTKHLANKKNGVRHLSVRRFLIRLGLRTAASDQRQPFLSQTPHESLPAHRRLTHMRPIVC